MIEKTQFFRRSGAATPDLAQQIALAVAQTQHLVATIAAGICPTCQQAMTLHKQDGTIFALPCGHRLYQGDLLPQGPGEPFA